MNQLRLSLPDGQITVHDLHEDRVTVGRLPDNTLHIEDDSVSSHHAELIAEGSTYRLKDLGSTNGSFVNGEPTTDSLLTAGDTIRFGQIDAEFIAESTGTGSQPLPDAERSEFAVGSTSGRPASFLNASPFPKPAEKSGPLAAVSIIIALIGALGFAAAIALTVTMAPPA